MIQIDKAIVSFDVFKKTFLCDLGACHGACCVEGDSGAPLEEEETKILDEVYPKVKKYMTPEGIQAIEEKGTWGVDADGDQVTTLVNNTECAFTYKDETGTVLCAIEKAYRNKEIDFYKPISCHLYPIRITKYASFDAVNYESNKLCVAARIKGERVGMPMFRFLKDPLIRKYGKEWYAQLTIAADELTKAGQI